MERDGMEGLSTKLYKFFILLVHIHYFTDISTIDVGMSSFFNMQKKRWELVDVWELKPIKCDNELARIVLLSTMTFVMMVIKLWLQKLSSL